MSIYIFYRVIFNIFNNKINRMDAMHIRNMQIQELVYENEELRKKIQGFNELQQCADELLYKLEGAKKREVDILTHNEQLEKELYEMER